MPVDLAERGKNMLSWGKRHMDQFYSQFAFQAMGPTEEREIDDYFASRHWKQTLNLIRDPDIIHVHCNLRLGVDPKILELKARQAFERQGWPIDKIVPNVFEVQGEYREYFDLTEISLPPSPSRNLVNLGLGSEPAPVSTTLATLVADPEPWEGVVISLTGLTVDTLPNSFGEWTVTDGVNVLMIDDDMYDASVGLNIGDPVNLIQGPLDYAFSAYRLQPRDANDIQ